MKMNKKQVLNLFCTGMSIYEVLSRLGFNCIDFTVRNNSDNDVFYIYFAIVEGIAKIRIDKSYNKVAWLEIEE